MATLVPVVAAALIDADGRVLMAKRPENKHMAGLWEFPGGKIDSGETPEEALVRELQEELGISTQTSCLAPLSFATEILEDFHLLILLFVCRKWEGVVTAHEHQLLRWVNPKDLLSLDMPAPDRPLAAQIRDLLCTR